MLEVKGHNSKGGDGIVIDRRKRRKIKPRKKYRGAAKNMPEFKPTWINAFIIMLLHKTGGSQSLTLNQLKAFDEVTTDKQPIFAWDGETQTFTITAPEYVVPVIEIPPKPKLIT